MHAQQQLNTSFDDETAALLNDCYTLEEKERLKEEWRLFEEQKRNFERERKNFTEAAIRLGREVLKASDVAPQSYSSYIVGVVTARLSIFFFFFFFNSTEKGLSRGPRYLAQESVFEHDSLY